MAYSFVVAFILGTVIEKTVGFRAKEEDEIAGIDLVCTARATRSELIVRSAPQARPGLQGRACGRSGVRPGRGAGGSTPGSGR